jgi:hypothetical protein
VLRFDIVRFQRRPLKRFVLHYLIARGAKTADHGEIDVFVAAEGVIIAKNNNTGCLCIVLDCTLVDLGMDEAGSGWFDLNKC